MADKFPEIDVDTTGQDIEGDFFSREKELVGSEFQTEQDSAVLAESEADEDHEIQDFKDQFPEVGEAEPAAQDPEPVSEDDEEFEGFSSAPQTTVPQGESEPLKEWKARRELEIEEREKANSKKKADIIAAAQQSIDDFYDNHNNKKEEQAKQVLKEQEEFLEKRDGFLKRGTLWDRVNELVEDAGEGADSSRDKSRFKGLLTKLKGKENVPGAGGYAS
ncbi:hypothetical protein METBIDRAFT_118879 [Metschnikowia bicuspidata var. bicuspidata NRRL YB-4993]|uniref:Clathrin light chain n=1 Tax=Metschnikowia bicuspidata var. bicuspidata NRRL YB-4993 TaxID=869754 RepID=A0A1A0HK35_9ASCO|nr:hypothetical protein METBIDRAFT_118879 [Metschnikowia bicuspidata var. bicuspidata NRRL YB-4993]OBA24168.1 hypothetical protein METBIDRAFT_118879 [Metschnikowia bicuspidata var. bicuspidata NRRL YB-4993]